MDCGPPLWCDAQRRYDPAGWGPWCDVPLTLMIYYDHSLNEPECTKTHKACTYSSTATSYYIIFTPTSYTWLKPPSPRVQIISKSLSKKLEDSASACSLQKHKNGTKQLVFCQHWKMNSNWLVKVTEVKVYTFSITKQLLL